MAQKSLLQMLEELASRVGSLEREKSEAAATMEALERGEREAVARAQELEHQKKQADATIEAFERGEQQAAAAMQELEREKKQAAVTIRGLEREVGELGALITLAAEKVDEILKVGADDDVSQPQAVAAPARSKVPRQLGEFSAATQSEPKERSSMPWRSD
jgi:chromosome segregation ATPase